jgi:hypothetical protein
MNNKRKIKKKKDDKKKKEQWLGDSVNKGPLEHSQIFSLSLSLSSPPPFSPCWGLIEPRSCAC